MDSHWWDPEWMIGSFNSGLISNLYRLGGWQASFDFVLEDLNWNIMPPTQLALKVQICGVAYDATCRIPAVNLEPSAGKISEIFHSEIWRCCHQVLHGQISCPTSLLGLYCGLKWSYKKTQLYKNTCCVVACSKLLKLYFRS